MKKVKFTENFGGRKLGDEVEYDSMLASHLVHVAKVAEYYEEKVWNFNKKKDDDSKVVEKKKVNKKKKK